MLLIPFSPWVPTEMTSLNRLSTFLDFFFLSSFIIFTQIFGFYTGTGEMNFFYRYMLDVSGLSAFFIIAAVLLMGVVALRILVAREEKKLYLEIIKENE